MASIPPGLAGKIEKFRPLPKPIRLQDSQNSARSRIENKLNTYRMLSVKSGLRLISFLPRLDMQSTYNPDRKTLGHLSNWAKSREFTVYASIVI